MQARFSSGMRVTIEVIALGESDRCVLSLIPAAATEETTAFDREFHRLNHVLTNCSIPRQEQVRERPAVVEEKIESWIAEVEEGIARLRKHRGARLSEEFYTKKS